MATLVLLLALVQGQDEFAAWIERLGSDSIEVREEASLRLKTLGPGSVERLEKAREAAPSPEVRARIDSIIAQIRKEAELAKVFGPTRRVTIASRGKPLKEILAELHAPGISEVVSGALDEEVRIDMQVRQATWWEALDRVARAAGGKYRIEPTKDGRFRISFAKGRELEAPVQYAEQFRIAVVETQRLELRGPGEVSKASMAVVEIRYQPDMKPVIQTFDDVLAIDSITDAKGEESKLERPKWANATSGGPRPLAHQEVVWIRSDAASPIVISGRTDVLFARKSREVALDFAGAGSSVRLDGIKLAVESLTPSTSETKVKLKAESQDPSRLADRVPDEIFLVDRAGKRHPGRKESTMSAETEVEWEFVFTSGIDGPRQVLVPWVEAFHPVRIPFRLEVRPPEMK